MSIRRSALCTAVVVFALVGAYRLGAQAAVAPQSASEDHQSKAFTLTGDLALWTVAIKPDKTSDYEKVLARVRDALQKSEKPERKQQASGWRVMKMDKPLPDGNIAYVHVIAPAGGADYALLKAVYDVFPLESQELYGLYRGAFAQNLALASGSIVMDMSKPQP